ncbi:MAG: squalene/phytoene synthase family protein [Myxococcales bacterium]
MTGAAYAAAKFASSTHDALSDDALKDFDNAGWVAALPGQVRKQWIERIRAIRLADRVVESGTPGLHVVRNQAEAFEGAAPEVRAAWNRYLAALDAYHGDFQLRTLAEHREMMDRLSGSLLQLVPFLQPHHFEPVRAFGVLDQFFNNLRDLAEDTAAGICYFPDDVLARFGLCREDVLSGRWRSMSGWRKLMSFWLDEYLPALEREAARFDECNNLHASVARMRDEFRLRYARIESLFREVDFDFERFAEEYWGEVRSRAEPAARAA